jgi:hypothetical protein
LITYHIGIKIFLSGKMGPFIAVGSKEKLVKE